MPNKSVFIFSCLCGRQFQKENKESFQCPDCGRLLIVEGGTEAHRWRFLARISMRMRRIDKGTREGFRRFIILPLPVRLKITAKLLCTIDAQREASGDQGIGSAVERAILDQELAELALEWMMNPQSPRVPNVSRIR